MPSLLAQVELSEVYQSYYHGNFSKFNAAQMGHEHRQEFNLRYSGFSGVKKVVNNVFINAYSLNKSEKLSYGLRFNNEQEGKFISRMNSDLALNYFVFKEEDRVLSAGLSGGFYNLFFKSDGLTTGGSGWTGDISFSSFYSAKTAWIGLALNHLYFDELQPINTVFKKPVYLNMIGGKEFLVAPKIKYVLSGMGEVFKNASPTIDVFQEVKYLQGVLALSLLKMETMAIVIGVEELKMKIGSLDLDFAYNVKFRSFDRVLSHKYELGMKFYLE